MGKIAKGAIRHALEVAQNNQIEEQIRNFDMSQVPKGSYNIFVFFNIQAVDGEGHAILGLGPVGGPIMTYSYYRDGDAISAPARMARLKTPETFQAICGANGWIVHGNEGNWWNEHVDACLALYCSPACYQAIDDYALEVTKNPGTYDLISNNCLDFVEDALAQGGVELLTHSGHALHNIAPREAFQDTRKVEGAEPFGKWKYWFHTCPAPQNGLRTISDEVW